MTTEAYVKIRGTWRSCSPYIKVNEKWRQPKAIYQKSDKNWKLVWGTEQSTYKEFGFCPYKSSPLRPVIYMDF